MDTPLILSIVSIVTTSIVGIILYRQIQAQTVLINHYKGFAEAVQPDKIITLHKRQIEQLQETTDNDIKKLQTQVIELGNYVDFVITDKEWVDKSINQPDLFNRQAHINRNLPSCSGVLDSIQKFNQSKTPNAQ